MTDAIDSGAHKVAEYALDWARAYSRNKNNAEYEMAVFLDALQHFTDAELRDDIETHLREAGLDIEGYPIDDATGEVLWHRDREFIPFREGKWNAPDFDRINAGHIAFARDWAKQNAAKFQAEWDALPDVPRTIEAHGMAKL